MYLVHITVFRIESQDNLKRKAKLLPSASHPILSPNVYPPPPRALGYEFTEGLQAEVNGVLLRGLVQELQRHCKRILLGFEAHQLSLWGRGGGGVKLEYLWNPKSTLLADNTWANAKVWTKQLSWVRSWMARGKEGRVGYSFLMISTPCHMVYDFLERACKDGGVIVLNHKNYTIENPPTNNTTPLICGAGVELG